MTVAAQRTVLAVARTVTSTGRVLDAVESFRDDPRVQVVFAINDSSPFSDGVWSLLRRAGARVVPWGQVPELRFDGVVTASENTELQSITAPVLVLQHGVGFHKDLPNSRGDGRRLAGVVRPDDLDGREVFIAVTHPQQKAQLAAIEPEAAKRAVLIVDPMVERFRAGRRLRHRYRAALGIGDRRLVVVSSTWGRQSLIGRWPSLPAQLLGQLNADEYAVASVLHPNVTSGHGALQVRLWMAAARDGGLMMVPPDAGWQATLAAADCVVGDHSSMSLLAAGADVPLLLAPLADEVVAGTPMTVLARLAQRLNVRDPLAEQVEATIATHVSGRYREAVEATFAQAPVARPLRTVLYELIGLSEPEEPGPVVAWAPPVPDSVAVHSFVVRSRLLDDVIEVRRFPAAVRRHVADPAQGWVGHLSATDQEWDLRMLHGAEVLTRASVTSAAAAWQWARITLEEFPGSGLACAGIAGGCVAAFRDGRRAVVTAETADITALAAGLYALARARRLTDGRWRVRTGQGVTDVAVRLTLGV